MQVNDRPRDMVEWKLVAAWERTSPIAVVEKWRGLGDARQSKYRAMLTQLRAGYPLDYLLPETVIGGVRLRIREGVLVPRPETEELIELIQATPGKPPTLVDIGCGSGLIGISLAQEFERVIMTDVSERALEIARGNVELNGTTNIEAVRSNLLADLPVITGDWWLVANLPYVPVADKLNQKEYRTEYEPDLAIYSGEDGLDLFRDLINQVGKLKNKPSRLWFELDPRNMRVALYILESELGVKGRVTKDADGLERFLWV